MKRDELSNTTNAMTKEELDNLYTYFLSTPSKEWTNKETCPYKFSRSYASIFLEKKGYTIKHNNKNIENNVNQRLIKGENNVNPMLVNIENNVNPMLIQFERTLLSTCKENLSLDQRTLYLSQETNDKLQELYDKYPLIPKKYVFEILVRAALENIKREE